jgi:hypothetical protein
MDSYVGNGMPLKYAGKVFSFYFFGPSYLVELVSRYSPILKLTVLCTPAFTQPSIIARPLFFLELGNITERWYGGGGILVLTE